jgi:hypothetical protein
MKKKGRKPRTQWEQLEEVVDRLSKTRDDFGTLVFYRADAVKIWNAAIRWERARIRAIHDRWYARRRAHPTNGNAP